MNLLNSDRIRLRPVEIEDLDLLYKLENDMDSWHAGDHLNPLSRFFLEQYILNASNDIYVDKQLRLVITQRSGEALGIIDLFEFDPHHRRAAVGIIIAPEARGHGYAGEALQMLVTYAEKVLQLKQLYCGVDRDNQKSFRLFTQKGFVHTGTRKAWRLSEKTWKDELFLQRIFDCPAKPEETGQ